MRNFLAVLLAIAAAVLATAGLVSWKVSELIHEPEPVQNILGGGQPAEEFKAAVPHALGTAAVGTTGVAVVDDAMSRAVTQATTRIVEHEDFDAAWSESLEATRSGWLEDIRQLRDQLTAGEPVEDTSTAAQLDLVLDPLASLTLTMVQDAIEDATSGIPGIEDIPVELDTQLEATVSTPIPPVSLLTAEQVVFAEELTTLWPAMLGMAVIIFVMALVISSRGSRWIVWLVTGAVAALMGALLKLGYAWMQRVVLAQADETNFELLQPFLRAVQEWAAPQLLVLIAASVGVALIGILGGFISSYRRRNDR